MSEKTTSKAIAWAYIKIPGRGWWGVAGMAR